MGLNFDTAMLIYRHWVIMTYSEKFLNIIDLRNCEDHYTNKRALGPLVALLRMTVNKGIGKHSSSQSPAVNSVSLRLSMGYADKIKRM